MLMAIVDGLYMHGKMLTHEYLKQDYPKTKEISYLPYLSFPSDPLPLTLTYHTNTTLPLRTLPCVAMILWPLESNACQCLPMVVSGVLYRLVCSFTGYSAPFHIRRVKLSHYLVSGLIIYGVVLAKALSPTC